jgi:hypothetical protein
MEEDGTLPSPDGEWSGKYGCSDGQGVLTSDAKAFVTALELALRELPDGCNDARSLATFVDFVHKAINEPVEDGIAFYIR